LDVRFGLPASQPRACAPPAAPGPTVTPKEIASVFGTVPRIFATHSNLSSLRDAKMRDEAWMKTLEDGRKVRFIYLELPDHGAFSTAQLAGNEVAYSVVLTNARIPLSRENVESHFKGELSKK
jgi:hypothetical protein